jgi:hypothetical protein
LKVQGVLRHEKNIKVYQGVEMEELQAKSRSCKNQTVQFWILEYPVFPEQMKSEQGLTFSLFRKDLVVGLRFSLFRRRFGRIRLKKLRHVAYINVGHD